MKQKVKATYWLLLALVLIGLLFRLYKVDNSLTEWFSWRQTDTAAVGKFFLKNGFNLLRPQYYDLSNIQSGMDNPQGWRFVEFPLYSAAFAFLYQAIGLFSFEVWARLVTIVLSLTTLAVVYYLLDQEYGRWEAFFGGLFFAISPFIVFYSRAILPDMPAVSLAMMAVFFFYLFAKHHRGWAFPAGTVFFALSLLVKPTAIFFAIIPLYLILTGRQTRTKKIILSGLFLALSALPLMWWRNYIKGFPEGIPASQWLLTSANTPAGLQNIFLRPAFFRWIFFERINNLILGGFMSFFVLLGLLIPHPGHKSVLHYVMAAGMVLYLFTFQGGNVQHEYYQTLITPALSMLVGVGAGAYLRQKKAGYMFVRAIVVIAIFVASFFYSFYQTENNYNESPHQLLTADIIRSLTRSDDIIVTDTTGDTTLLYLSDRRGYPAPYKDTEELKKQGAKYFVTSDLSYKERFQGRYRLVFENDQVLIFAL